MTAATPPTPPTPPTSTEPVLLELDGAVATITLNRPETLNLVSVVVRDALIEAVLAVRDMPDVRAVVLAAAGRHFSAGADLSEFGSADTVFEARRIRWDRDPWGPLWSLPQPVVVALHGYALAAGLEMALLCDIRLAATDTVVGLPETRLGMLPAAGGTQSLTKAIGPVAALPWVLTADNIPAHVAVERAILHRLVPHDAAAESPAEAVNTAAAELARRWAAIDPTLVQAAKRALRGAAELDLDAGLALERRLARLARAARDTRQTPVGASREDRR
ncbi:MAG: enoyl-CoA hydratase/isomerase family protein [Acidimicrobiales bacterium]